MPEANESPVTKGYRKFFDIYRADIDRIPRFDEFVLALREALRTCVEATGKKGATEDLAGNSNDLKNLRVRAGLSLKALARKAGVSVLTVRGIERGTIKRPQGATMKKIDAALERELELKRE